MVNFIGSGHDRLSLFVVNLVDVDVSKTHTFCDSSYALILTDRIVG